jgi:putative membrane protein
MMGPGYGWGYDMMGGTGWLGGLLVLLFGALVIAGIVVIIIWAVRSSGGNAPSGGSPRSGTTADQDEAISIARRRLASGDIDARQYDEIIRALKAD